GKSAYSWPMYPMGRAHAGTQAPPVRGSSNQDFPSSAINPRSGTSSPASRRRSVVFPAPLSPTTTRVRPSSCSISMSSETPGAPPVPAGRALAVRIVSIGPGSVPAGRERPQREQQRERENQEDDRQGHGGLHVRLQGDIDGERQRLSAPRQVAGERDGRSELTEGPGPGHGAAGDERGEGERQQHPPERVGRRGAQGGGRLAVPGLHFTQARRRGRHEEGQGH